MTRKSVNRAVVDVIICSIVNFFLPKKVTVPSTGGGSPDCDGGAILFEHLERFRSFVKSPLVSDFRFSPTADWSAAAGWGSFVGELIAEVAARVDRLCVGGGAFDFGNGLSKDCCCCA